MSIITKNKVLTKFAFLRDKAMSGAKVNCTYQTDTFAGLRTSLDLQQVANTYGLVNDYEFSIYAESTDLTTRIRNNERITINDTAVDVGGVSKTMRVLGKSIDASGAVIRLDIKALQS
jgi:hypothetical protein